MSTKHTPGPWRVEYDNDGAPSAIVRADGGESVECNCPECAGKEWGGRTYTELVTCDSHVYGPPIQDARLMAAAPELLDLVRAYSGTVQPVTLAKLDKLAQALLARIDGEEAEQS